MWQPQFGLQDIIRDGPHIQGPQAKIPQFFNFIGSSSGVSQAASPIPANVEENVSIFNLPQTMGLPPKLLEVYGQQMRNLKGNVESQPTEEESSTISSREEARIRAEVRSVMNQQFAIARAKLKVIQLHKRKLW